MSLQICFLGAGQMATALAVGLCKSGFADAGAIAACDPDPAARERFAGEVAGARVVQTLEQAADRIDVLVIAVKPHIARAVLPQVAERVDASTLVVSIAAGVQVAEMETALSNGTRVVRVMPNTPCLVGDSASAYSRGTSATDDDAQLVQRMLDSVGIALEVPELLLDAVTGLSGSGPAYVYAVIEALSDGGVLMGLPRDVALKLAAQTVRGAAEMVLRTGEHPAALRDKVTSPGGTTIAGLRVAEQAGLRSAMVEAVAAATKRSAELGNR